MVLGLAIATGLIVSMQLPLLHQRATSHAVLALLSTHEATTPLDWPIIGNAAVDIPAYGVLVRHHDSVVPIASLTKMMTAYVTLQRLPLGPGESGPCITTTANDLLTYQADQLRGDSSAAVVVGEQLCEFDLLSGLLVHSAANYADLLASMVSGSTINFVATMNATAAQLGLSNTHYADPSGILSESVSTAGDQARLAVLLMNSALVRAIVDQTNVRLPVAGVVSSFTPLVGVDNVIGVKSGRTIAAGGCDVMAMTFQQSGYTRVVYSVVLGQRGGDLLGPAGLAALALSRSALQQRIEQSFNAGSTFGWIGWGSRVVPFGFASNYQIWRWAPKDSAPFTLDFKVLTKTIRRGEVVGWLNVPGHEPRLKLVAQRTISPPTLFQRLL